MFPTRGDAVRLGLGFIYWPILGPAQQEASSTQFGFCRVGGGINGDTFWFNGERIRVADIDTPETHLLRCDTEAELDNRATRRLHQPLNVSPVSDNPIVMLSAVPGA